MKQVSEVPVKNLSHQCVCPNANVGSKYVHEAQSNQSGACFDVYLKLKLIFLRWGVAFDVQLSWLWFTIGSPQRKGPNAHQTKRQTCGRLKTKKVCTNRNRSRI